MFTMKHYHIEAWNTCVHVLEEAATTLADKITRTSYRTAYQCPISMSALAIKNIFSLKIMKM